MNMRFNRDHAQAILPPSPRKAVVAALDRLPNREGSVEDIIEEILAHPDAGCAEGLAWALEFLRAHPTGETMPAMLLVLEALLASLPPDHRGQKELRLELLEEIRARIERLGQVPAGFGWDRRWRTFEVYLPSEDDRRPYDWSIALGVRHALGDRSPEASAILWSALRLDILRLLDDDVRADYLNGEDWSCRRADSHVIEVVYAWGELLLHDGTSDRARPVVRRLLRDLIPALEASTIAALSGAGSGR